MFQYKTWIFCCSLIAIFNFAAPDNWPADVDGMIIVPLSIRSTDYTQAALDIFKDGIYDIQNITCVRFVDRDAELNYIDVFDGGNGDCGGAVGMKGGKQNLKLTNACMLNRKKGVHELIHGLGFRHMHQRFDRDSYIYVNYTNIALDNQQYFDILDNEAEAFDTTYDYLSCMHYAKNGFSKNGLYTIIPDDPYYLDLIGVQPTLSSGDATRINRMYNCPSPYQ